METHSSVLAWRIPWTENPDGLQSMGSQRVLPDSGSKHKVLLIREKYKCESENHSVVLSPWSIQSMEFSRSLLLLHGIFPTQGINPGLPHSRRLLYLLSHKGSPRILGWVASLFSSRFSRPRIQMGVSCSAGQFFTN